MNVHSKQQNLQTMAIGIFVLLLLTLIPLYTEAADCTGLPTGTDLDNGLQAAINSDVGEGGQLLDQIENGPFYTCQVQGTTVGTYQMLSAIVTYTVGGDSTVRVRQFELNCLEFNSMFSWEAVSGSLAAVDTNVDYVNIAVRTNCGSCSNTASNDHNCQACDPACNDGLMRCTGTGSDDCCAAFEENNCISTTTCNETNFVAIEQNNYICAACGLTDCGDGYVFNSTLCSCVLVNICQADNPCTNGVCELISPDQYTCDCTGTNYIGTNCSECDLPDSACDDGYIVNSTTCSCVLDNICQADNPCTNGVCNLISSPDNYTCDCTGTNYMGTNCSECSLNCDNGYEADTSCIDCVLSVICAAANPCDNGATCVEGSAPHLYTCQCVDYYNGVNCTGCGLECLNNGTIDENCQTCVCDTGFTGLNCSSCDDGYTLESENGICNPESSPFQWWWVVVPVVILVVLVAIILIISFIIFKVVRYKDGKSTTDKSGVEMK